MYYIVIAIVSIVFIIIALFYLTKGLLVLTGWFLRLLPTMIKAAIYLAIVALTWSMLKDRINQLPQLPAIVYLVLYFVILGMLLVRRYVKYGYLFKSSSGDYKGYVLNKKSKVIHRKYSDSEETISPQHKKEVSYSEAMDLINNNKKYHFKQDN